MACGVELVHEDLDLERVQAVPLSSLGILVLVGQPLSVEPLIVEGGHEQHVLASVQLVRLTAESESWVER